MLRAALRGFQAAATGTLLTVRRSYMSVPVLETLLASWRSALVVIIFLRCEKLVNSARTSKLACRAMPSAPRGFHTFTAIVPAIRSVFAPRIAPEAVTCRLQAHSVNNALTIQVRTLKAPRRQIRKRKLIKYKLKSRKSVTKRFFRMADGTLKYWPAGRGHLSAGDDCILVLMRVCSVLSNIYST
jgi:hypothetical protein